MFQTNFSSLYRSCRTSMKWKRLPSLSFWYCHTEIFLHVTNLLPLYILFYFMHYSIFQCSLSGIFFYSETGPMSLRSFCYALILPPPPQQLQAWTKTVLSCHTQIDTLLSCCKINYTTFVLILLIFIIISFHYIVTTFCFSGRFN